MRCLSLLMLFGLATPVLRAADEPRPPNVVILFADDMGYGDLGCYGAEKIRTPNLDGMAKAGVRFTDFHVAQPVCSASRAALLTGCYPNRLGIHGALNPQAKHGLSDKETTIAEVCKSRDYSTAAIGKWHLGHLPPFLPTKHGFDSYLGLPYSNDMWPYHPAGKKANYPNLPLIENDKIIDDDVTAETQSTLTRRYTERATEFIEKNSKQPFFLYVAYAMPHVPLFPGVKFKGKSNAGVYGDVIEEIDWSVGEVLAALKKAGVEENTLVIFSSDNGPWLVYGNHGGSAGPLREGKGTNFEGGTRVPCIARWPGKIPAGSVQSQPCMTIDILPTVAKRIGAELPKLKIDGLDCWPLFACESGAKNPHDAYFFYYNSGDLQAVRSGNWKLMLPQTARSMVGGEPGKDGKPGKYASLKLENELYDLSNDLGETKNVADKYPDEVKALLEYAEAARKDLGDAATKRKGAGVREPGRVQ